MTHAFPGQVVPVVTQWQGLALITAILVAHYFFRRARR